MKTLMLHLNDTIYEEVKAFLLRLPQNELKIEEPETQSLIVEPSFTFEEFERKWAGFINSDEISENWKEDRVEYLNRKHR